MYPTLGVRSITTASCAQLNVTFKLVKYKYTLVQESTGWGITIVHFVTEGKGTLADEIQQGSKLPLSGKTIQKRTSQTIMNCAEGIIK